MRNRIAIIAAALCLNFVPLSQANTILSENFDNVSGLAGGGWAIVNNSAPLGATSWFQGNDGVFPAYSGNPNSYIAANYVNAGLSGNISDWLITPQLSLSGLIEITFFTRTDTGSEFPDRLQLRFSSNGASTNVGASDSSVGDFSTLLLTVNPTLSEGGYPDDWTQVTAQILLASPVSGRFAFRYAVTNTDLNGNYIGIDSLSISEVPEPSLTAFLLCSGVAIAVNRRRLRGLSHREATNTIES